MMEVKQEYKSQDLKSKEERTYKVNVLGKKTQEVVASSEKEALEKAGVPSSFKTERSGDVITAYLGISGGLD